jgi:ribosomal protein S18 acetylase RimI-like enzyme
VSDGLIIRDARAGDEGDILALLKEFAEFEQLTHIFRLTREIIARDFIDEHRRVICQIAEVDGATAGVMIWCRTYATFSASPGIYIEDLYVRPQFRRRGIAKALLQRLAREDGANYIHWCVLDWNRAAAEFYERIGAARTAEWELYRISGEALQQLAKT